MGSWGSVPAKKTEVNSAKVLPEVKQETKVIILRHRPTCLSTDIEQGLTESTENPQNVDTDVQ